MWAKKAILELVKLFSQGGRDAKRQLYYYTASFVNCKSQTLANFCVGPLEARDNQRHRCFFLHST